MNNFSKVLKELMAQKGLNQQDTANLLQVRQSQVSNWLNGKSMPGYYSIKQICEKFGVKPDVLLGITE